jgi:hypothetical protein
MNTLADMMLRLGYLTGSLHEVHQREQLVELLRSEDGEVTARWLVMLRDSIAQVLREAGREAGFPPEEGQVHV